MKNYKKMQIKNYEAFPFYIKQFFDSHQNENAIIIAENNSTAKTLNSNLRFLLDRDKFQITTIPQLDLDLCEKSTPDPFLLFNRSLGLSKILTNENDKINQIVITTPRAILYRITSADELKESILKIKTGDCVDLINLRKQIASLGYRIVDMPTILGDASFVGEIATIISNQDYGIRLIFDDQKIEAIKTFKLNSHFSHIENISKAEFFPTSEIIYNQVNIDRFIKKYQTKGLDEDQNFNLIKEQSSYGNYYPYLPLFCESTELLFDYVKNPNIIFTTISRSKTEKEIQSIEKMYNHYKTVNPNTILPPQDSYITKREFNKLINKNCFEFTIEDIL